MTQIPRVAREVRLAMHAEGLPGPEHFAIVEAPVRAPAAHEVLVRNRWFRISVSMQLMIRAGAQRIEGIPYPTFGVGDTLAGAAIGEVIQASAESGLRRGDRVSHPFGWREYATLPREACVPLDSTDVDPAACLGHGWTAYAALTRGVPVRRGDTVFVSSGAGAIGAMAAQIARRLGAERVIGSTRSADKAAWMKAELGYDAVLVGGDGRALAERLAEAAPQGIDVYVDLVGGAPLQAALRAARKGARFVLLGALGAEAGVGARPSAPVTLDSVELILKGVTVRGYSADDDWPHVYDEWMRRLAEWRSDGGLSLPCSTFRGLDQAPAALHEACAGRLRGVVLVELP